MPEAATAGTDGIVKTVTRTGGTVIPAPGGIRAGGPSMAMTGAPRILEWVIEMYQVNDKPLFRQMFRVFVEQDESELAKAASMRMVEQQPLLQSGPGLVDF